MRFSVGLLGERDVAGWWRSGFMSPTAPAFLAPIFGAKVLHAQYQGLIESARRIHDERIGVGRVFHPFRLPEAQEQRTWHALRSAGESSIANISSFETAINTLEGISGKPVDVKPGPTLVGTVDLLNGPNWVAEVSAIYLSAFNSSIQCFPYFTDAQ